MVKKSNMRSKLEPVSRTSLLVSTTQVFFKGLLSIGSRGGPTGNGVSMGQTDLDEKEGIMNDLLQLREGPYGKPGDLSISNDKVF